MCAPLHSNNGNCGPKISRRRGHRQNVRLAGRAPSAALPETVREAADSGAAADAATESARRAPAEVHPIRDRLVHCAENHEGSETFRAGILWRAGVQIRRFVLSISLTKQHWPVRDVRFAARDL